MFPAFGGWAEDIRLSLGLSALSILQAGPAFPATPSAFFTVFYVLSFVWFPWDICTFPGDCVCPLSWSDG